MKKIAIISTLLALSMSFTFGQTASDTISMKKVFGSYQFYQGEQRLKMNQLINTMKPNEQAYEQIQSAQSTNIIAIALSSAGGFLIGWYIGDALREGGSNWNMIGIGAGLVVVSIPISHNFNIKARQAVETYNSGLLQTSSFWDKNELKISFSGNGIGLTLNF